jgi:hypothetical protein
VAAGAGVKLNSIRVSIGKVPEGGAEAKCTSVEAACVFHYENYEGKERRRSRKTTAITSAKKADNETIATDYGLTV